MSWEMFLRLWRWGNVIAFLGVLQFAVCLTLAMRSYAGGSPLDPRTVGYTFYGNFLSDLGRHVAWSGAPNAASAGLFNTSLVVLAAAQLPYFLFLPLHAPDKAAWLWVAAGFGIISCFGLAGVGLTPYDRFMGAHLTALMWWIVPLLMALVLHFLALFGSDECSPLFPLVSLALALLVSTYILRTLVFGLPPHTDEDAASLLKSIALQKYVLFASVGWYLLFSVRMLLTIKAPLPDRESVVDQEAKEYLRHWERKG